MYIKITEFPVLINRDLENKFVKLFSKSEDKSKKVILFPFYRYDTNENVCR